MLINWVIKKGCKFSFPRKLINFSFRKPVVRGYFMFDDRSLYEMDDYPQWNKLSGISSGLKPNKSSNIIAWRCIQNRIEIVPYFNNREGKIFVNSNDIIKIDLWKWYYFRVDKYSITIGDNIFTQPFLIRINNWIYTIIQPYFGGVRKAPSKVKGSIIYH